MPVMGIREVRVAVRDRQVPVRMRMARTRRDRSFMGMVVMFVTAAVFMFVAVLKRLMDMRMLMAFSEMQPDTPRHQCTRRDQRQRQRLTQEGNRQGRAHKRRDGKVRACAGRPQVAQSKNKQCQAGPIACKTQQRGRQHDGDLGPRCAQGKRKHQVGGARGQSFHHSDE